MRNNDFPENTTKKAYQTPYAEMIVFDTNDMIVTSSIEECDEFWTIKNKRPCSDQFVGYNN